MSAVNDCPANPKFGNIHEFRVAGTPRSAMTYYECRLCGFRYERGPGLFYRPPSDHTDHTPPDSADGGVCKACDTPPRPVSDDRAECRCGAMTLWKLPIK